MLVSFSDTIGIASRPIKHHSIFSGVSPLHLHPMSRGCPTISGDSCPEMTISPEPCKMIVKRKRYQQIVIIFIILTMRPLLVNDVQK